MIVDGKDHYPTIKQLEWAAEQSYGGGTGRVDSREYYELVYFEPLEQFLYEVLRAKYPDMNVTDICVCELVWINQRSIGTNDYDTLKDRLANVVFPTLDRIPDGEHEHARYVYENKNAIPKGKKLDKDSELFPEYLGAEYAIGKAHEHGYIRYSFGEEQKITDWLEAAAPPDTFDEDGARINHSEYVVTPKIQVELRQDIFDTLEDAFLKECAAADAALIAAGHGDKITQLNEEHRKKQAVFEEYASSFYYRQGKATTTDDRRLTQ
jgi:hypothetical protein